MKWNRSLIWTEMGYQICFKGFVPSYEYTGFSYLTMEVEHITEAFQFNWDAFNVIHKYCNKDDKSTL